LYIYEIKGENGEGDVVTPENVHEIPITLKNIIMRDDMKKISK